MLGPRVYRRRDGRNAAPLRLREVREGLLRLETRHRPRRQGEVLLLQARDGRRGRETRWPPPAATRPPEGKGARARGAPIAGRARGEMGEGRMPSFPAGRENPAPPAPIAMPPGARGPPPPPIAAPWTSATTGLGHASIE